MPDTLSRPTSGRSAGEGHPSARASDCLAGAGWTRDRIGSARGRPVVLGLGEVVLEHGGCADADYALSWLKINVKHDGVRVLEGRAGHVLAGSLQRSISGQTMRTDTRDGRIVGKSDRVRYECMLNSSYSPTEQLATRAHELGHLYCGHVGAPSGAWWKDRSTVPHLEKEFEGETTAQVVFRRVAPEAELPPHLDPYCHTDAPRVEGCDWSVVMGAATRVIEMAQGDSPTRK